MSKNDPAERAVRDIRRKTRKQYSAEEKIRIVVSGLRGEDSIAELCRREGIAESLYPGFPMWHPSAKLRVARNRSKGKSDGFCHQDHARQHEIESEWDMVAFDIAGRAVPRTHRSCRLHA